MTTETDKFSDDKITCQIDGVRVHTIKAHLDKNHPDWTLERYRQAYPDAPVLSETAKRKMEEMLAKRRAAGKESKAQVDTKTNMSYMHDVFGINKSTKGALNQHGKPIPIKVMDNAPEGYEEFVPEVDENYIFNIDTLKTALMGVESGFNVYLKGHAGTGKSTLIEQICARTKRAMIRVQHTVNTEESHILGQWIVKDGDTVWQPSPLALCMKYGLVYQADEYDRAIPQVLSVYQPVLEIGKPLVVKDAPPEWRVVKPHPDFRFCATGNTNGAGDSTGLYTSTMLQDFANFERFTIMLEVDWMSEKQESSVVAGQAKIPLEDARQLVKFAQEVRNGVDNGMIGSPISPRALIAAGQIGVRFQNYGLGLKLAYTNRLSDVDREACEQIAQRHFSRK